MRILRQNANYSGLRIKRDAPFNQITRQMHAERRKNRFELLSSNLLSAPISLCVCSWPVFTKISILSSLIHAKIPILFYVSARTKNSKKGMHSFCLRLHFKLLIYEEFLENTVACTVDKIKKTASLIHFLVLC